MQKMKFFVFFTSFSFLFISLSFAIDRETLWTKLNFPSSLAEMREMDRVARQNLGMVEEILFFSDMQRDSSCARDNALQILKECSEKGLITKEHFFEIILRLYGQINTIAHPTRVEDSKNNIKGAMASYGRANLPLASNFSAFPSLTNSLSSAGFIKNQGILNSLNQKISNAKDILDKRGPDAKNTAIKKVQAAINELSAQRGNGVSEDGYQILSGYCQNLITKIQTTN